MLTPTRAPLYASHEHQPFDQGTGAWDELGAGGRPVVGEQIVELLDRALPDAREHIVEPCEWFDSGEFARSDEAAQHGHGSAAAIAAEEGPVAAADGNAAQAPLGVVVVDGQVAVGEVARQGRPVLQRVGDGLAGRAARQNFFANGLQKLVQLVEQGPGSLLAQQA